MEHYKTTVKEKISLFGVIIGIVIGVSTSAFGFSFTYYQSTQNKADIIAMKDKDIQGIKSDYKNLKDEMLKSNILLKEEIAKMNTNIALLRSDIKYTNAILRKLSKGRI